MAYQVLARKWRPQQFADVLGQEHITRTLQNAIQADRVGHAYLFVGPRGIGKTTTARIFAKALNCAHAQTDDQGHIEPCCECLSCKEIAAGNCLDVMEIDGASHNRVEHVRDLCENVQYAPTNGRQHKIYIIDEVHMLTTQAWNALLKTLEEPPPHVKFLFATTEAHKVLATILSRTQRFDLKRIVVPTIVRRLREIADAEKIFIDDDALTIIARAAEGGMRDAQSIFDQMIAFCGGQDEASTIHEQDVISVFGLSSQGQLKRLVGSMLENDPGNLVAAVHELADKGRDLERLYSDLLQTVRNLMVYQVAAEPAKILALSQAELDDLKELAAVGNPELAQRLADGMLRCGDEIRHTLNKRVFIEVTLLKIVQDAHAMQVDDLLTTLRKVKKQGGVTLPASAESSAAESKPAQAESIPAADARAAAASTDAPESGENDQAETPKAPPPHAPQPATGPAEPAPGASVAPAAPRTDTVETETAAAPVVETTDETDPSADAAVPQPGRRMESNSQVYRNVQANPFVQKICNLFHGEVIDVRG